MPLGELTWNEAIEKVLKDAGEPMSYLDITEQIITQGLRLKPGATPTYTVAANLSLDKKLGEFSKFVNLARGIYGLREWQAVGAEQQPDPVTEAVEDPAAGLQISAYGMYWERDAVDWSKAAPRVLGQQYESSAPVDFLEQRGIYVLYDHARIVYVGRATKQSLGTRLRDHTVDRLRARWDRFSWFGFWGVNEDGTLRQNWHATEGVDGVVGLLETVLIELSEPPLNRKQGDGLTVAEYLQAEDPAIGKKKKQAMIAEVLAKMTGE